MKAVRLRIAKNIVGASAAGALAFFIWTTDVFAASGSGTDLSGVWWSTQKIPAIHPDDGTQIPFTASGRAAYARNKALVQDIARKPPSLHDMRRCLPAGIPREWGSGFPFQIMQRPNEIIIAYEHDHIRRFGYLDEKLDIDAADPAYMGNSVGHWDGDTLVIESGAYKPSTFLDDTGLPHGENLKITERFKKLGEGKALEVLATIEDPEMYSKAWTVRYTFASHPDERIQEYTCGIGVIRSRFGTIGQMPKLRHHGS